MTDLVIFPTAPALRQWQKRRLAHTAFLDGRGTMTTAAFLADCTAAALQAGNLAVNGRPLRMGDDFDRELAIVEACRNFRTRVSPQSMLGKLSDVALEEVLGRLIHYIAPLADQAEDFLSELEKDAFQKNQQLAALYRCFDQALQTRGIASRARINAAILTTLSRRETWPDCLSGRDLDRVIFRGLRWVPPFVERVSALLEAELGEGQVLLSHVLEEYEQDWWGRNLFPCTGQLIFGESRESWEPFHAPSTIQRVDRFLGLRDAAAVQDAVIADDCRGRIGFNESVGRYGEIQDLARRIAHAIEQGTAPDRICLTARKLGDYSDAVSDVFARFGIPYYFRRGIPVMSTAVVKDVLLLVQYARSRKRDDLCAILSSRWLSFSDYFEDFDLPHIHASNLAHTLMVAGVEPRIDSLDVVENRLRNYLRGGERNEKLLEAYMTVLRDLQFSGSGSRRHFVEHLVSLCKRYRVLGMLNHWAKQSLEGESRARRSYILNARAYGVLFDVLDSLRNSDDAKSPSTWAELDNLLERSLANMTVQDPHSSDSGVWVLTPHDLAGLEFDMICCAGMNSGEFPALPEQSPIFSDAELRRYREALGAPLPAAALSISEARNSQENLLFLSVLAAASERLVFSRTAKDESGLELPESVYFTTLWRLAGLPTAGDRPSEDQLDPYERWRLQHGGRVYQDIWKETLNAANAFDRRPFPGESWIGILPAQLCRASDELRQSAAAGKAVPGEGQPGPLDRLVERGLTTEHMRLRFFDEAASGKELSELLDDSATAAFVGVLDPKAWKALQPDGPLLDFSPTALETLAVCPYKYYLSRILSLEPIQTNELEASPMDYGTAVHEIMNIGMRLLRGDTDLPESCPVSVKRASKKHAHLCHPSWVIPDAEGWRLVDDPGDHDRAMPAVVMDLKHKLEDYADFFMCLCDALQEAVESGALNWMMGAPEQSDLTWNRIRTSVRCLLEAQLSVEPKHLKKKFSAGGEPHIQIGEDALKRCTVFIEQVFDDRDFCNPVSGALEIHHPDDPSKSIKVHGVVDRVDLLCDQSGLVRAVYVIDYKGRSKRDKKPEVLAEEITEGFDCQLPVYGLMARRLLYPDGGGEDLPVILQYLVYNHSVKEMATNLQNHFICLDGRPLEKEALDDLTGGESLLDAFARRLFELVSVLEGGRFVVQSANCDYCDFASQCRYPLSRIKMETDND
jgi:RecB family exonuclease